MLKRFDRVGQGSADGLGQNGGEAEGDHKQRREQEILDPQSCPVGEALREQAVDIVGDGCGN